MVAESFAIKVTAPPVVLMAALTVMSRPACAVMPAPVVLRATESVKVISWVACSTTLAPAPSSEAGLMLTLAPASAKSSMSPIAAAPASSTTISVGSSINVPMAPLLAVAST